MGGKNILPMAKLVELLTKMALSDIKTYIQSGNVVFSTEDCDLRHLSERIGASIEKNYRFRPQIQLWPVADFEQAVKNNPFHELETEADKLHLFFLSEKPREADMLKMMTLKTDNEQYRLIDRVFYLAAMNGIGRSKLAAGCERLLAVSATARNWRTVQKIRQLAFLSSEY